MKRWLSYGLLTVVVGIALFFGTRSAGGPPGPAARAAHISTEVRCPTCEGLSAAESEAPASLAIRKEIRRRVEAGESDDEVRSFLVGRYGVDILLRPASTGVAAMVWALPVAALVCSLAGLALAFRRWRARTLREGGGASAADHLLVQEALRR
ncbi:MAG: cytochrome c-type biogenesis protein CcmH [Acidimicrobiales bacterium]